MIRHNKNKLSKKTIGSIKISQQILLAMVILSITATVVIGAVVFVFSKRVIENNYRSAHEYNLQVSSNIIDIQLKSIMEQERMLLVNEEFKKAFKDDPSKTAYFSSKNRLILERILGDTVSMDSTIQAILVANEKGNWNFYSKNNSKSGYLRHFYTTDDILKEHWVSAAKEESGKEVFYGYNVLYDDGKNDTFTIVKNLINPSTQESMGYMAMLVKNSLFDKAFGTKDEGYTTNRYLILDLDKNAESDKSVVYFNGDDEDKNQIIEEYSNESKKYLFSTYHNKTSNWEIVNVIEKNELTDDSNYIAAITLIMAVIVILLSIKISSMISKRISRPLLTLEQTINEVGEGNYKVSAEFGDDEIGSIGNKFKNMVNNNLELRERLLNTEIKEREAELLLLQSQINPHFLYNTLDSLYFMAVIHNADDIADMVMALSDTFKLSLNKGDKLIFVKDELEKIKAYMKIQNMRYNNRFELQINVREEMLNFKILAFILQPLVENAVYHGLEAKVGNGYIRIEGYIKDGKQYFEVLDNGVGIDDFSKLEKGYGIRNIRERIRLMHGEEYTISFESEINSGTKVTAVVPISK